MVAAALLVYLSSLSLMNSTSTLRRQYQQLSTYAIACVDVLVACHFVKNKRNTSLAIFVDDSPSCPFTKVLHNVLIVPSSMNIPRKQHIQI